MSQAGVENLTDNVRKAVEYVVAEFDMTVAEVAGTLQTMAIELIVFEREEREAQQ